MDTFSDDLFKKIESLLSLQIGDATRLEHIKKSILENKKLYRSDIQNVNDLEKKISNKFESNEEINYEKSQKLCYNCEKELESSVRFCSYCGTDQNEKNSDFTEILSRRRKIEYNPLKIIQNLHSYQILAVLGGFCALVPIISALVALDRIFEVLEFYSGKDFSEFYLGFVGLGLISGIWSASVMIIPFLIKKPKKVGKFLFFSSIGILIFSLLTGIVGFVIILFAGIFALKKRRY